MPTRAPWSAALLLPLLLVACATVPKRGSLETLKPAIETFHQRIRWRDYRGACELVVAERRDAFLAARKAKNDDKDLSVTDYQLEDVRLSADGQTAVVASRIGWVRLPSVSESSELVTSEWTFQAGAWFLASQDVGPFTPELADPYQRPDAGT